MKCKIWRFICNYQFGSISDQYTENIVQFKKFLNTHYICFETSMAFQLNQEGLLEKAGHISEKPCRSLCSSLSNYYL